jgi:radical SAM superfamily enzyme YgiQ (UPF0313 family)
MRSYDKNYFNPSSIIDGIDKTILGGTKVTLINLPIREQATPNNPPLGLALLASQLQRYGVEVNIIDLNSYRIQDSDSKILQLSNGRVLNDDETYKLLADTFNKCGNQDLIGLSGLITTLDWQAKIAKYIRKLQPESLLVSGGGLATEFRGILFKWIPELDGVAHSEGDDIILKIAFDAKIIHEYGLKSAINSGKLDPYYLGLHKGRPRFFYDGGRPNDLDNLPFPAWDLIKTDVYGQPVLEKYIQTPVWGMDANNSSAANFSMERSLSMISSRGCPFACNFCFRGAQGERNYGVRSAQNIIDEIVYDYDNYNVDFIGIVDDNFMVQPKRINDLADKIKPILSDINIRWGTHGRLDEAADLRPGKDDTFVMNKIKRVDQMSEAGCVYIGFGAESASPNTLEAMGKGGFILSNGLVDINGYSFPRTMIEGIKNSKNANIHANCTWIMGYPGETLLDLKTTVAFIKWQEEFYTEGLNPGTAEYNSNLSSVNKMLFVASAYPGTEMFKDPVVREKLNKTFNINFENNNGNPIPDKNFRNYVSSLDDATKVLEGEGGTLFYGNMEVDDFLTARSYVENNEIYKILDM